MLRSWARFQRLPLGGYQTVREDHPARRLVFGGTGQQDPVPVAVRQPCREHPRRMACPAISSLDANPGQP